ncbi:hypothetical protein ACFL3Y_01160 [Pseudomonadota bacterium]
MCNSMYQAPAVQPVVAKMRPKYGDTFSPIQLADDTKPTASEKKALEAYFEVRAACRQLYTSLFNKHNTIGVASVQRYWSMSDKIDASLYSGNITYGEAASLKDSANEQALSEIATASQQAQNSETQRREKLNAVYSGILNRDPSRQTAVGAAAAAMNGEPPKTTSDIVTCKRVMGKPYGQIAQFERMCPMNWQEI